VCRLSTGERSFYSGREGAAHHRQVDHGDGATVAERSGRGRGAVQRVLAVLLVVMARLGGV
jgi:hypothetical protein